jgi:hypothetical protein
MSDMKNYRALVITLLFVEVIYSFTSWGWSYFGGQDALYWVGYGAILHRNLDIVITYATSAGFLISYIGLYFLQNWARYLLLVTTMVSVLLAPLYGISVSSGMESMMGYFLAVFSGVVLAMSFYSGVANYFHKE